METKTRILIADANPDFSSLLSDLIAGEKDMEVAGTADNGVDALGLLDELEPDVLLLDLVLSKLDGLELLRRVSESGRKVHIIVLSGFVNSKVVGECSALGADYFLSKPCDPAALLTRIRQLCAEPLQSAGTGCHSNGNGGRHGLGIGGGGFRLSQGGLSGNGFSFSLRGQRGNGHACHHNSNQQGNKNSFQRGFHDLATSFFLICRSVTSP